MITISMPLYIEMGFKCKNRKPILDKEGNKIPKKYHINLNNYRNWHHQASNNLKIKYKEIMNEKVLNLKLDFVQISFILHRPDKRKVDRSNILSIHEKFFCDGLVDLGCITDDNDDYLAYTSYHTGLMNKENPRVDVQITELPRLH